jgi:hypothetical protein
MPEIQPILPVFGDGVSLLNGDDEHPESSGNGLVNRIEYEMADGRFTKFEWKRSPQFVLTKNRSKL